MLLLIIVGAILFGAAYIILSWVLPKETFASLIRGVDKGMALFFKLVVVAAAAGIVYLLVSSS